MGAVFESHFVQRVWKRAARREIVDPGEEISREDAEEFLSTVI